MQSTATPRAAAALIDSRPLSAYQRLILVLCGSVIFLDGLDTQSISVATKAMAHALDVPLASFGVVFSVLQLGGLIGTFVFGYLADRVGRRPLVIAAALLIGALTLGTASVENYTQLLIVRFLGGIGLGGIFPCVLALGAEYVHSRSRGLAVAVLFANYSLGAAVGAVVNGYVLAHFGWRAVYVVGGALSIAAALAIVAWLPESPHFLISRGKTQKLRAVFSRLFPGETIDVDQLRLNAAAGAAQVTRKGVPVREIFSEGRAGITLLLLGILMLSYATIKVMTVWLTPLLQTAGISVVQTSYVLASLDIGSMLGLGLAGYLVSRFGPTRSLLPALLVLAVTTVVVAFEVTRFAALLPGGFVIGFTGGIGQSAPLALFALIFPTRVRSTALGLGGAAGQIGKIGSPMLVGAVLANGWKPDTILFAVALLPAIGVLLMLLVRLSRRYAVASVSQSA
ncbi:MULTISPECIES: MFS transporter [Paraburkholderia]|uniref:MFS transporter n=1 Tax=Paraburkholderia TaxID=1822464 RepID=UPI0006D40344|nr:MULTISPECIES: MFS transporter [Paraburkholderia]ALP67616.1 4-hydroxybenzoate transporter [Paraburkholderia caribensis]AUT57348.1 4-hydroxybenzoate transporter [Paraburkholderia caribensis]